MHYVMGGFTGGIATAFQPNYREDTDLFLGSFNCSVISKHGGATKVHIIAEEVGRHHVHYTVG